MRFDLCSVYGWNDREAKLAAHMALGLRRKEQGLGVYLNGRSAYNLFPEDFSLTYYMERIQALLVDDLSEAYPDVKIRGADG